jgi:hypothetical protein
MNQVPLLCLALLLAGTRLPAQEAPPARKAKVPVEKPSDLPARRYAIQASPSELVQSQEAVAALAGRVEQDLKADLDAFEGRDGATLQNLHTTLFVTAMLRKDLSAAAKHLERVRGLREDPTARLMTGLLTGPLIQAMGAPGKDLHATYRALLSQRLAELPFKEVEPLLDRMRMGQKGASKEQVLEGLRAGLDPLVKEGRLGEAEAGSLLGAALNLHILLPMREDTVACLEGLFETHKADGAAAKPLPTPLGTTRIAANGPHFGQALPGETPVRFAPDVLKALSPWVSGLAFSPDGTECFLHVGDANYGGANMYYSQCVDGVWSPLVQPAFLAGFSASMEPVFSKDGHTLTFTARKGREATDLWTVSRTAAGWGSPVAVPAPINSDLNEFRGSWTADGTFYFGSERASAGINQVFKARRNAAGTWVVDKLGAPINALSYDGDPCIAPDGRFLIYYAGRANGHGRVDLYVTFSDGRGGWGPAINLGPTFNGPDDEFGASLSPDGKQLFFNRHTPQGDQLYWVAVSAIDKLKP